MKIESNDRTVDQLLRTGYFRIPRFQRGYSWETNEVEDFWNDTVVDSSSDYFIGSIVLFRYADDVFGIVDGQQRLTTITMLLCSLRNFISGEGFIDLAQGLHQLVERRDIGNKNQYVLQTESSYPFLQEQIQKFGDSAHEVVTTDEEARLKRGYEFLRDSLASTINAIHHDKSSSNTKKRSKAKSKLLQIRDKILKLKLIVIVLQSEEDAYLIFETLNTRGKDLTVSDMVRTHLTRLQPQTNRNVDRPKERFNDIIASFQASEAEVSINSFLHHYWLSRHEYTTEKKLYKAIKKRIRTRDAAGTLLGSLEADAAMYRIIHEPPARKWPLEALGLRDSLIALNLFRVRQQIPFVLSVLGEYEEGRLPLKHARRALAAVENFHFAFTAVTSQRSSGGISFMYALHARQLRSASTTRDKAKVINDLVAKLRAKRPSYQEFEADFREILCSEKYTKRKPLVQYILGRMTAHFMPGVPIDHERMTIEHIANQSTSLGSSFSDEEVAAVGNLLLVSDSLNTKLGSRSFSAKIGLLGNAQVWIDDYLKKQSVWGTSQIRNRTDSLAKLAYKDVWPV